MADGFACAEDPAGLPMPELMRLFEAGLPLSHMRSELMGESGVLTMADTPEGAALRNSMHNRVQADAFVPGGGRPASINMANWRDFLQAAPRPRLLLTPSVGTVCSHLATAAFCRRTARRARG